ncbi:exo-alpha-sialidase [Angustibacter peucedani]
MPDPDPSVLLAIGTRKGLWLARSDDRRTWALDGPHLLMTEVPSVAIDTRDGRTHLMVGARSEHWGPTVQHSDDLGRSWTEHEGGAVVFPDDAGSALERVWQIHPDTAARPGVVWAGCEPTSLWRSEDGGLTFSLVQGLWDHPHRPQWYPGFGGAAVHTVVPHPDDDDRVLVAMSTGGVYTSDDHGTSWQPHNQGIKVSFMPDPYPEFGQCVHKVAPAGSDGGRLFAQNHHGVYRSDDGGRSWTSVADGLPADFGFVVLGHPRDRDTAWVVPLVADAERVPPQGQLRVHRTTDGGSTWVVSESGLPDGCWVTPLRDAACVDDLDPVGVYLGTRAGSVYASADEGRTFTTVAENLPDVLSVRAAALV